MPTKLNKEQRRAFIVGLVTKSRNAKAAAVVAPVDVAEFHSIEAEEGELLGEGDRDAGLSLNPASKDIYDELDTLPGFRTNVLSNEAEEMFYGFVEKSEKTED